MRKLNVVSSKTKTASERNLEAKEMLKSLLQQLEESLSVVKELKDNFEDVLLPNKVRDLFESVKKLEDVRKTLAK